MIKKKRINLFTKTSRKGLTFFFTDKIVLYATILGIFLFIVFLSINFINFTQKNRIQSLLEEKQNYLKFFVDNTESEAQARLFLLKKQQLDKFMKDDAQFLFYYNVLNTSLSISSSSPRIESLGIDKDKNTTFAIIFNDYDSMYTFIKYVESDVFIKNFNELTLKSFSLAQNISGKSTGYKLSFEGSFKILENNVWTK